MSRHLYAGIAIAVLLLSVFIAALPLVPVAAETECIPKKFLIQLVYPQKGTPSTLPLANKKIIVAVANETGNYVMAYTPVETTTNGTGWFEFTVCVPATVIGGTYNITILTPVTIGDKTVYFVLYKASGLSWDQLVALNLTALTVEYYPMKFQVFAKIAGTGGYEPFNGTIGGTTYAKVKVEVKAELDLSGDGSVDLEAKIWEDYAGKDALTGWFNYTKVYVQEPYAIELYTEGAGGKLWIPKTAEIVYNVTTYWGELKVNSTKAPASTFLGARGASPATDAHAVPIIVAIYKATIQVRDYAGNVIPFIGGDAWAYLETPGGYILGRARIGPGDNATSAPLYFPNATVALRVFYFGAEVYYKLDNYYKLIEDWLAANNTLPYPVNASLKKFAIKIEGIVDYSQIKVAYVFKTAGEMRTFEKPVRGTGYIVLPPFIEDGEDSYYGDFGYVPICDIEVKVYTIDGALLKEEVVPKSEVESKSEYVITVSAIAEARFKIVALDGETLGSAEYAAAKFQIIDVESGAVISEGTLPPNGVIMYRGSGGKFTIKIYWKGVWLEPVEPKEVEVLGIVPEPIVVKFPVADVKIKLVTWTDAEEPVEGLNATLVYADGFKEPWSRSGADGVVTFKHVPLGVDVKLEVYTWNTPFTRTYGAAPTKLGPDDNIKVYEETFAIPETTEPLVELTKAVWIVDVKIVAYDAEGNVLKSFTVYYDKGDKLVPVTYPVTLVLVEKEGNETAAEVAASTEIEPFKYYSKYGLYYFTVTAKPHAGFWTYWLTEYNFKIVEAKSVAEFLLESKVEREKALKPCVYLTTGHYFIAGQKYWVRIIYGGVVVYNGTIVPELPAKGEPAVVELKTSVLKYKVYAFTKTKFEGAFWLVPNLKVMLSLEPALNITRDSEPLFDIKYYDVLIYNKKLGIGTAWDSYKVSYDGKNYYWLPATVIGTDGYAEFIVPAWCPAGKNVDWDIWFYAPGSPTGDWAPIKYGTYMAQLKVLASKALGTPGFIEDAETNVIDSHYPIYRFGYAWNATYESTWNYTYVKALAPVTVKVLDPVGAPLAGEEVRLYIGTETKDEWARTTDAEGLATFGPAALKYVELPNGTSYPLVAPESFVFWEGKAWYHFETEDKLAKELKPYVAEKIGIDLLVPVLRAPISGLYSFTAANYTEVIEMRWKGLFIVAKDLKDMPASGLVVLLMPHEASKIGIRYVGVGITDEQGIAIVKLGGVRSPITGEYLPWDELAGYFLFDAYWCEEALKTPGLKVIPVTRSQMIRWTELKAYLEEGKIWPLPPARLYDLKIRFATEFDTDVVVFVKTPSGEVIKKAADLKAGAENVVPVSTQAPEGTYEVLAYAAVKIPGLKKPYYIVLPAKTASLGGEAPEVTVEIKVPAYRVTVKVVSAGIESKPLASAKVALKYTFKAVEEPAAEAPAEVPEVTVDLGTFTLDAEGKTPELLLPAAGKIEVTLVSWKGVAINKKLAEVEVIESKEITLPYTELGALVVKVAGRKGTGLAGASVIIKYEGKVIESGVTDESGVFTTVLPAGTYEVAVDFKGYTDSKSVTVAPGATATAEIVFEEIYAVIFGRPWSLGMIVGVIVLAIIVIILIVIVLHEYSLYRRRKLLPAVVPAAPGAPKK